MRADHKLSVIVQDEQFEIERFPLAMSKGCKLAVDGVPVATIRPAVEVDPKAADLRIEVAADGVSIGFFAKDGQCGLVNLDTLSAGVPVSSKSARALRAWADDRRKQANAVPA